jgi:hypothetical protein
LKLEHFKVLRHCLDSVGCYNTSTKASQASSWIPVLTMATVPCKLLNLLTAELAFNLERVQGTNYRTCWIGAHRVNDFLAGEAKRGVTEFNRTNSETTKQVKAYFMISDYHIVGDILTSVWFWCNSSL